jgi:hypothetical protein
VSSRTVPLYKSQLEEMVNGLGIAYHYEPTVVVLIKIVYALYRRVVG